MECIEESVKIFQNKELVILIIIVEFEIWLTMTAGEEKWCSVEVQSLSVHPAFLHGVLWTLDLLPRPRSRSSTGRFGLKGVETLVGVGLVDREMSRICLNFPSVNFFSIQAISVSLAFLSVINFSVLWVNRFIALKTTSRELK